MGRLNWRVQELPQEEDDVDRGRLKVVYLPVLLSFGLDWYFPCFISLGLLDDRMSVAVWCGYWGAASLR